jgi:antitoxin component of MazEF toxin-antitoxin module
MGELTFITRLDPRGPAAAVVLEDGQVAVLGEGAKRFPVAATVNGYTWRTSVARMGGEYLVGLSKAVRQAAGVEVGDEVEVTLRLDIEPRDVEVPQALSDALESDPVAAAAYQGLAYTHRKEYARWIGEAKQASTRDRRIQQALEMLRNGQTRS